MKRSMMRDLSMVMLGALLMFLFFEFSPDSPLNTLREAYNELLPQLPR